MADLAVAFASTLDLISIIFLREDLVMDRLEMLSIEVRKLSTKPFVITTWYGPLTLQWIFSLILIYF